MNIEEMRAEYSAVEALWANAVERARALPEAARQQRVNGEWSFVETMRHLVFATDAWIGRSLLGKDQPFHPWDVSHGEMSVEDGLSVGLDPDARPSFDEVVALRAERQELVRRVLETLTDEALEREATQGPTPDFPDERPSFSTCVRVVLNEERAHHGYAMRDLAILESRPRRTMRVTGPVLDAADPVGLARFYERLLGWPIVEVEGPREGAPTEDGWAKLRSPGGEMKIEFQYEPLYVRPEWPPVEGQQQMMIHLDVECDDLPAAVAWAIELGATLADHQPQAGVRVMLDPEGHPFCLFEGSPG